MKKLTVLLSLLLCVLFALKAQIDERPSNPGAVTPPPRVVNTSVNTERRSSNNSVSASGLSYRLSSELGYREATVLESMINNMVYVEGGTFMMGATEEQIPESPDDDEYPAHEVTVGDFYIEIYYMLSCKNGFSLIKCY